MSNNLENQLQKLTNKELIDFALEHLGLENEAIRTAALQEHFSRIKDAPSRRLSSNCTENPAKAETIVPYSFQP